MGDSTSRSNKTGRRIRRLEKTVESLSHGLILALTQLKSGDMHADTEPHHHGSGPGPHHRHHRPGHSDVANHEIESVSREHSAYYDDDDDDRDLSTVFARLGFKENCTETLIFMLVALDTDHMCMRSARRDRYGGTAVAEAG